MTDASIRPSRLAHAVARGTAWTGLSTGVRAVLRLGTLAVLARLLSPEIFGLVAALGVVLHLGQSLGLLGLAPALIREAELGRREIATAQVLALGLTGLMAGGVVLLAGPIAALFAMPGLVEILPAAGVLLMLQGLSSVARARMDRDLGFGRSARIEILAAVFGYSTVSVALALAGFGIWSLVGGQLAQAAVATGLLVWAYPPVFAQIHLATARRFFRFGGGFSLAMVLDRAAVQVDYVIVGRLLGAEALGLYARAYQLVAGQARGATQGLARVLFPALAKLQDARDRRVRAYRRSLALAVLPTGVMAALVWALAPELVWILLGPGWEAAVQPLAWLSLALVPRAAVRINGALLKATGRVGRLAGLSLLHLVCVAMGAWIGARWGVGGVAAGVAVGIWAHFLGSCLVTLGSEALPFTALIRGLQPGALAVAVVLGAHGCGIIALGVVLAGLVLWAGPAWLVGPDAHWARAMVRDRLKPAKQSPAAGAPDPDGPPSS